MFKDIFIESNPINNCVLRYTGVSFRLYMFKDIFIEPNPVNNCVLRYTGVSFRLYMFKDIFIEPNPVNNCVLRYTGVSFRLYMFKDIFIEPNPVNNCVLRYTGVSLQSQAAYELASKGLIRPAGKSVPLIYNIRCTHYKAPDFTIEVNCINENELYLKQVVHDLGLTLKSCAVCTQLRQTRYGHFTLDHALLRKHWTLEHILNNILYSRELVTPEKITPASSKLQLITGSSQESRSAVVS
ncbi:probable tRNA pseudouridine synthase 2 [Limulus polyphemus]|uniref:Probable tRNA pseudouridine synthase 2 n=1 Tax=Limulus polyphemus TaxID=6850 RepID=A0ABM1BZP0_LIMPO|nr:probable tRNA pseudouridine synthase 2 [Limulus polyphemus]